MTGPKAITASNAIARRCSYLWFLIASILLSGCGGLKSTTATTIPNSTASTRPIQAATTSTTTTVVSENWPTLIIDAMAIVGSKTKMPLEAPSSLPGPPDQANSATVMNTSTKYRVDLFHCETALPIDDPAIGSGQCGGLASVYGSFGGELFPTPAAARAAVNARLKVPSGCDQVTKAQLDPGVVAELYSANDIPCVAIWHLSKWTYQVDGDLSLVGLSGKAQWLPFAQSIVSYSMAHTLPPAGGVFSCDIAGDGLHTALAWNNSNTLYSVSVYHQAIPALSIAASMKPFPVP